MKIVQRILFCFIVIGLTKSYGSEIKSDESVVFFTTVAHLDEVKQEWVIPIHGWIYEPEDSVVRKAAIVKILKEAYGLMTSEATQANFNRRVNLLLVDNERGKMLSIRLLGEDYLLERSKANGHFHGLIRLPSEKVDFSVKSGIIDFRANLKVSDPREFSGRVLLLASRGVSVVSDIDDTVKLSHVIDKKRLFESTFFKDFEAIPGMSALYRGWAEQGAQFHFVSSSPWHLYAPLDEFLETSGFPEASISLKLIRLKDRSVLNLFKQGTETKPVPIEALIKRFPERQFILVGDSGEHDPEVYAGIYRKYPDQIRSIYIRAVLGSDTSQERFQRLFEGVPDGVWQLFSAPEEIIDRSL